MSKWNQREICTWAVDTFGEPGCAKDIFDRTNDEYQELYDVFFDKSFQKHPGFLDTKDVVDEAADVVIMLYQLVNHCGFDLMEAVDRKMEINANRKWINTGIGIGKHQ